jgi:acyl-coenzyme A synthetase/AMP-(fatty) acid ligase
MIYIDGIKYLESDNEHVRTAVINYLENWNITVSTSGTTGTPKVYTHSDKLMRKVAEYNAEYFMLDSNSSMMSLNNPR